jgi:hypothetical protein
VRFGHFLHNKLVSELLVFDLCNCLGDLVFIKKFEIPRCGKICFLWVKRCSLFSKFGGSSTTKMKKKNFEFEFGIWTLDFANLLTKWLLDLGYLDLNLDFPDMLITMVIGFWIFGFEFRPHVKQQAGHA